MDVGSNKCCGCAGPCSCLHNRVVVGQHLLHVYINYIYIESQSFFSKLSFSTRILYHLFDISYIHISIHSILASPHIIIQSRASVKSRFLFIGKCGRRFCHSFQLCLSLSHSTPTASSGILIVSFFGIN
jgi:hypothetical protein